MFRLMFSKNISFLNLMEKVLSFVDYKINDYLIITNEYFYVNLSDYYHLMFTLIILIVFLFFKNQHSIIFLITKRILKMFYERNRLKFFINPWMNIIPFSKEDPLTRSLILFTIMNFIS